MKVIIKTHVGLGQATDLDVDPKELVKNIKERAAVTQAVDANSVVLSFEGDILDDRRRLKEYGVSDGSTLNLLPKHQKGGSTSHFYFYQNEPVLSSFNPIPPTPSLVAICLTNLPKCETALVISIYICSPNDSAVV